MLSALTEKVWKYLYRAVDKEGKTVDFLLMAKRDKAAALRFFEKAMKANGAPEKVTDLVKQTRCASAAEKQTTLALYLTTYNHHIPQRALKHQTPIQALQKWRADKPELFVKRVYKPAGLDT